MVHRISRLSLSYSLRTDASARKEKIDGVIMTSGIQLGYSHLRVQQRLAVFQFYMMRTGSRKSVCLVCPRLLITCTIQDRYNGRRQQLNGDGHRVVVRLVQAVLKSLPLLGSKKGCQDFSCSMPIHNRHCVVQGSITSKGWLERSVYFLCLCFDASA